MSSCKPTYGIVFALQRKTCPCPGFCTGVVHVQRFRGNEADEFGTTGAAHELVGGAAYTPDADVMNSLQALAGRRPSECRYLRGINRKRAEKMYFIETKARLLKSVKCTTRCAPLGHGCASQLDFENLSCISKKILFTERFRGIEADKVGTTGAAQYNLT